jgi:hypothetical protein
VLVDDDDESSVLNKPRNPKDVKGFEPTWFDGHVADASSCRMEVLRKISNGRCAVFVSILYTSWGDASIVYLLGCGPRCGVRDH